jgi:DNA-binding MarR family transcriptional regulator
MKIFEQLGRVALGTRVRFLGERITEDAAKIYELYGIEMNPKWFPVFYVLSKNDQKTITAIAEEIGHSHVSVSKIVAEMVKARFVSEKTSTEDRRRTMVSLTKAGKEVATKIEDQYLDVKAAVEELSEQSENDLWKALEEWENLLTEKPLLRRVLENKKRRESANVKIVPYTEKYRAAFEKLNLEWIKSYFKVEKADRDALDDPKGYILDRGGFIFVALMDDKPVGVCALLKRDDPAYPYELAKMAVSPSSPW